LSSPSWRGIARIIVVVITSTTSFIIILLHITVIVKSWLIIRI
jgi:hypothetical protein